MSIFQVTIFEDASLGMTQEANYHEKDAWVPKSVLGVNLFYVTKAI